MANNLLVSVVLFIPLPRAIGEIRVQVSEIEWKIENLVRDFPKCIRNAERPDPPTVE